MGPKYLFVINSLMAGGAERSLLDMLPAMTGRGVTPVIACLYSRDIGFEEEARDAGWDVRLLAGRGLVGKVRALRRLIADERPDLVYTSLFDADIAGRLAAVGRDVPVMSNLANTAYDPARLDDPNVRRGRLRLVQAVDGFTARHFTDHFHAVSNAVKDSTVETMGVAPQRITVVHRGRDAARLGEPGTQRRHRVRQALGVPDDAEVVITVGRQEYQKGQVHLVEAFAAVVQQRPRARLLVVGREGHASADLAAATSRLGLGDVATFLGHRTDVADLLAASDLFAVPSLYEGLGGALIEALALGLPVVASDLPALREVVEPGVNADLVPAGDSSALAGAIITLLGDPERRARYGEASRRRFHDEFRSEAAFARTLELLAEVATPASGPDDATLARVMATLRDRRGPLADPAVAYTVERRWPSFKAHFALLTLSGGARAAVKVAGNWTAEDAGFVAAESDRVARLLADLPGGPVRVPGVLGWTPDPPALALEWVEATDLLDVFGDPAHPLAPTLPALVGSCGEALGAYHAAEPADPDDRPSAKAARIELLGAARRAGVSRSAAEAAWPRLHRARGYRYSPGDFLVDGEGGVVLLDPPHVRKFDPVHRDVSAFTFEMHRRVVGDRPARGDAAARRLAELRSAFLAGYARTGPVALTDPIDLWAIRLYELSRVTGRIYGEMRRRRGRPLPGLTWWATSARRALGRLPGEGTKY